MRHTKTNKKQFRKTKRSKKPISMKKWLQIGGGSELETKDIDNFIFRSDKVSLQPNTDPNYKEVGVIHVTESSAVNFVRGTATGFANLFGSKGFDNTIYDQARNSALNKLLSIVGHNQKVCNLRMDVTGEYELFFVHLRGTLLEPAVSRQPAQHQQAVVHQATSTPAPVMQQ